MLGFLTLQEGHKSGSCLSEKVAGRPILDASPLSSRRPRLGALLNRVVGVGLMYLLFSIIEGVLRVTSVRGGGRQRGDEGGAALEQLDPGPDARLRPSQDQTSLAALACEIFLAFVDSCIVWWISFLGDGSEGGELERAGGGSFSQQCT